MMKISIKPQPKTEMISEEIIIQVFDFLIFFKHFGFHGNQ